ncbi:MAG: glycosyltransferase [Christensenellaceae bacterium]|nr:glycosyltransferase [Christensenellaceae bacterium]
MLVSVIIPVYNTEKYLRQCLDSVLGQTMPDLEVLCVNDGSTDGSADILTEYEEKDPRVRVFTRKNSGVGASRNFALRHAKGEFILLVDSDDYIDADTLELLVAQITKTNADICCFNAAEFDARTGEEIYHEYALPAYLKGREVFSAKDTAEHIFIVSSNISWNKLYRAEYLRAHPLFFQELSPFEDTYFNYAVMLYAERITLLNRKFYHYRKFRENSQMNSDALRLNGFIESCISARKYLEQSHLLDDPIIRRSFDRKLAAILFYVSALYHAERPEFEQFYHHLRGENGLQQLGLFPQEDGYYGGGLNEDRLKILFASDEPADFLFMEYHVLKRIYPEQQQKTVSARRQANAAKKKAETLEKQLVSLKKEKAALAEKHRLLLQEKDILAENHSLLLRENDALAEDHRLLLQENDALAENHRLLSQEHTALKENYRSLKQKHQALTKKYRAVTKSRTYRFARRLRKLLTLNGRIRFKK